MKLLKRKVLSAVLTMSVSCVFAGTMGAVESNPNFGGFYAGLGTGMMTLMSNLSYSVTRVPTLSPSYSGKASYTDTAVLFDGHLGYGQMFHEKAYLGAKASVFYTPLKHEQQGPYAAANGSLLTISNNMNTLTLKPFYNVDAVLGYEVLPHLLPFVEAGVTFANVNTRYRGARTQSNVSTGTTSYYSFALNSNKYTTGGNVGVGAKYLVNKNWFLSSELIYSYLGKDSVGTSIAVPATTTTDNHNRSRTNQAVSLLAGVSYLFPNS